MKRVSAFLDMRRCNNCDSITNFMDVNSHKLRETVRDREAWHAAVHGVARSWTWLSNWTAARIEIMESVPENICLKTCFTSSPGAVPHSPLWTPFRVCQSCSGTEADGKCSWQAPICLWQGGTGTLPHWLTFICFCVPSLLKLVTIWFCLLELRDCLGGWNLTPQARNGRPEKAWHLGGSYRVLLSFRFPFSLLLLNLGNRCWTRKRLTFQIERLIINLTEEISFRGGWFQRQL